jgi:hypothetical protein
MNFALDQLVYGHNCSLFSLFPLLLDLQFFLFLLLMQLFESHSTVKISLLVTLQINYINCNRILTKIMLYKLFLQLF